MNRFYLIDQYCVDLNGHAVVNIYPALLWQQLYLIWLCNNGGRLTNTLPPHNKMAFDRPTIPEMALPEHNRWRYTSTCCLKRSPTNCSYLVFHLTIYCRVFVGESFQTTAIRQTEKDLYKRTAQSVNTWPVSCITSRVRARPVLNTFLIAVQFVLYQLFSYFTSYISAQVNCLLYGQTNKNTSHLYEMYEEK